MTVLYNKNFPPIDVRVIRRLVREIFRCRRRWTCKLSYDDVEHDFRPDFFSDTFFITNLIGKRYTLKLRRPDDNYVRKSEVISNNVSNIETVVGIEGRRDEDIEQWEIYDAYMNGHDIFVGI